MEEHEKNILKLELLEASHFREVVWLYYTTCVELILRMLLALDATPSEAFVAGKYKVSKASFQKSLFDIENMPIHVKSILSSMVFNAINDSSIIHFCTLLELDKAGEEAPMSIDHVLTQLDLPENKRKIEKLLGKSEEILDRLQEESRQLWKEHGEAAKSAFRNAVVHGHVHAYDQSSETFKAFAKKQNSIDLYKAMEGIHKILCRISVLCFNESELPDKEEYWHAFWNGNMDSIIWCFDLDKYPKDMKPIDPHERTLSREDLK